MTNGEKMVWAAVFAREMEALKNPPPYVFADPDIKWKEWEHSQTCSACEVACGAVDRLREVVSTGRLYEGFGDIGGVVQMATDITEL